MKAPGAARLLTVLAIVVTGLGLAAPPAGAALALTVSDGDDLLDRQVVTVEGTGFAAGEQVLLTQCAGAAPDGCVLDPPVNQNGAYATATSTGTVRATLRLSRVLDLPGEDVSCAESACSVAALVRETDEERVRTPIDFAPTGTAPAPPDAALAIDVEDMRADGGTAAYTGSGYLPWFRISFVHFDEPVPLSLADAVDGGDGGGAYLAICTPPAVGWSGCDRFVSPLIPAGSSGSAFKLHQWVPVAEDGTVSEAGRPMPRMWDTEDGRIDCAVADCSFALEQDGAPHSNVADVAWAPEWAPFPSATTFVTAAYSSLLGRAPTASERATTIAGLTDRSITGFGLLLDLAGRDDARPLAELTRLYLAALGRAPDGPGLLYWEGELRRTGSMSQIAQAFGRTREFRRTYVTGVSDAQAVELAYQRTLGRDPSAADRSYWVGRLQGGLSRTHMIHLFSRTPEYLRREGGRSRASAVIVALLGRGPSAEEWYQLSPGYLIRDLRTPAQRVDDTVLAVLSSDHLVEAVG